ncbi:MAG: zinc-ribbon domain-containing protein, partial [bacterium]|nr:zinc-ribbon domain-containing protein [bacterium]
MICKSCGAQVADNSVFCTNCGVRIQPVSGVVPGSVAVPAEPPVQPEAGQESAESENTAQAGAEVQPEAGQESAEPENTAQAGAEAQPEAGQESAEPENTAQTGAEVQAQAGQESAEPENTAQIGAEVQAQAGSIPDSQPQMQINGQTPYG